MTQDEALCLALEALETLHDENMDYLTRNKLGGENNQCMVFAREAITAIKAALAEKPEPVGTAGELFSNTALERLDLRPSTGIYITPPPRTWQGLTEDDKVLIKHDADFNQFITAGEYADRVQQLTEARLKDKNT